MPRSRPATRPGVRLSLLVVVLAATPLLGQDGEAASDDSEFGAYADTGLPFFGQTLDARGLGAGFPANNLTPRGLILDLEDGYHACFDPDLLRLALVWRAEAESSALSMIGMAPGSYRQPHRKAPAGQDQLPTPLGEPLLATGLHAGVQFGSELSLDDPREPSADPEEPGRGPLQADLGRWLGLRLEQGGPVLLYEIGGTRIEERLGVARTASNRAVLSRRLLVGPHEEALTVISAAGVTHRIPPSPNEENWTLPVALGDHPEALPPKASQRPATAAPERLWPETIRVPVPARPTTPAAFVIEEIPLPLPNPWRRNVRPSSLDFFPDGRLALLTFDGDVWIADKVQGAAREISWQRFAGGLHEPMGLRVEGGTIVVFDRNGLVRLHDRDANGEADHYENLSSIAAQTAETREFAMGFELKPGGGYYLAKGGQVAGTRGKLNGCVVELSADGQAMQVIARGLRQPFIAVDPKTGTLTASDQQGHWVPATPLHVIARGHYYGFRPVRLGPDAPAPQPITEPPLWIPHFVNQSGSRQVWIRNANMGELNDALLHLGYNRPALFRAFLAPDRSQGAIVPVLEGFPTGLLDGRVNPADGQLYLGGLNIWGSVGERLRGLYRVRPGGQPSWIPQAVQAFDQGVLLRFAQPLDPAQATTASHYTVDRWNYQRSAKYGSGHYTLAGEPGQETLPVARVYLSTDRRAVFLALPGMEPCDSLRVTYRVAAPTPTPRLQHAYLTIHRLAPADPPTLGFETKVIDLTPGAQSADGRPALIPSVEAGREIATQYGCIGCHSVDGSRAVNPEPTMVVGPSWKGLYGSKREFTDGTVVKNADAVYLRESIIDPARKVTKGFETGATGVGMPSYLGVLDDAQVEALILYLKSLR